MSKIFVNEFSCRTCLEQSDNLTSIFLDGQLYNKLLTLSDLITICVDLSIARDDTLPKYICNSCINELSRIYHFRQQCNRANNYLLEIENIKMEEADLDESEFIKTEPDMEIFEYLENENCDTLDENYSANDDSNHSYFIIKEADSNEIEKPSENKYDEEIIDRPSNVQLEPKKKKKKIRKKVNLKCPYCPRVVTSLTSYNLHLEIHSTEEKYLCMTCGKRFLTKLRYLTHLSVHDDKNRCEICNKTWTSKSKLEQHMRIHTGERPFKCDVCEKTFSQRSALNTHLRVHTGERPYKCKFCDFAFKTNSAYHEHMRSHINSRNHKCAICEKTFNKFSIYKNHMTIHATDIIYECPICLKDCMSKYKLKTHRKKFHKEYLSEPSKDEI